MASLLKGSLVFFQGYYVRVDRGTKRVTTRVTIRMITTTVTFRMGGSQVC